MTSITTHAFAFGIVLLHLGVAIGDNPALILPFEMQKQSIDGCMTTACHGSNVPDAKIWQRAGKIWFDQDPHAQAYTSLLTAASVKIVSRLVNEELKPSSQAYRDILKAKCVSCHASENAPETQLALGADCQVCHGSVDAWGSQHYSSEWKALGKSRFDDTKMFNVESLVSRAQVCSSCHIGELNRRGRLDREVDHTLMAAGHPPMHFDFESFSRRYPVHWDTKDERVGIGSSMGLERWRIGKITSAITRLKLLVARAERATSQSATMHDWPELTEYSCSSCHHALVQPSWRLSSRVISIANWDDWNISQLDSSIRDQSVVELKAQITSLKSHIERVAPDPKSVAISAESLRLWLESELKQVSSARENSVEIILLKLQAQVETFPKFRNWESASQWYIATRVLTEALGIKCSVEPVSLLKHDPFTDENKVWKPVASKEFKGSSVFQPDMLGNYHNELMKQLRKRP